MEFKHYLKIDLLPHTKIQVVPITKTGRLMLFSETIEFFYENHEQTNTFCGQNADFLTSSKWYTEQPLRSEGLNIREIVIPLFWAICYPDTGSERVGLALGTCIQEEQEQEYRILGCGALWVYYNPTFR
jgi:hypothetical protein